MYVVEFCYIGGTPRLVTALLYSPPLISTHQRTLGLTAEGSAILWQHLISTHHDSARLLSSQLNSSNPQRLIWGFCYISGTSPLTSAPLSSRHLISDRLIREPLALPLGVLPYHGGTSLHVTSRLIAAHQNPGYKAGACYIETLDIPSQHDSTPLNSTQPITTKSLWHYR